MDSREIELLGIRVIDEKQNGEWTTFNGGEILFIDTWYPYGRKSNHCVPRFHTERGMFTMVWTMAMCESIFTHLEATDTSNLVNVSMIDYCEIIPGTKVLLARFKNSSSPANIAWSKLGKFSHLVRNKEALPPKLRK